MNNKKKKGSKSTASRVMKTKKKTPARVSILEQLRKQILQGQLHYGERLVETEIAERLKVSRTPVREAFRELENEGLVEHSPGRGVTVSRMAEEDILELYPIRAVLEGLAARMAAEKISDRDLKTLKEVFRQMDECFASGDYKTYVKLHTEFNEAIYEAAESPQLHAMVTRFHEYTERSQLRALSVDKRFESVRKEHRAILRAIERHRPEEAEAAFRYHIEQAQSAFLQSLAPEKLIAELTK